jgi:protein-L-isoaspartate(D-aspartate) O-methyltransferase
LDRPVVAQPLLFTLEFRRKMAELSQRDRLEWLGSVARRLRAAPGFALEQELREVARGCRLPLVDSVQKQLGPFDARHLRALLEVPRERFVRPEDIEKSADDTPLPLDERGLSTVSAPHAYLLSYRLLELAPGDSLVELGTGSGYGAALAAFIVEGRGRVRTFEIDASLALRAERNLADAPGVTVVHGDAMASPERWGGASKAVVTFAVEELPRAWLEALPNGGRIVAPVGKREEDQRLILVRREADRLLRSEHGGVRYVRNRSGR